MSTVSTEATSASAQLPGIRGVSKVAAGTYKLEPAHTQVLFTFNHLGFTDYTGQFVQPSGSLTIEPGRLRERLQCSRPRARQRLVKQAARRRCEIVLGSARLLVLGGVIFC
jgi:hypothetical protein